MQSEVTSVSDENRSSLSATPTLHIHQQALYKFPTQPPSPSVDFNEKIATLQLEDTQLERYSLLDDWNPEADFPSLGETFEDQAKLLAHKLGDSFIKSSSLEGHTLEKTAKNLKATLAYLRQNPRFLTQEEMLYFNDLDDILESLIEQDLKLNGIAEQENPLVHIQKVAKDTAEKILDLKEKESFFMHGGWAGHPGHAMLYEFVRVSPSGFDLFVYDTAGLIYQDRLNAGFKVKHRPLIRYANIKVEELFFCPSNEPIKIDLFVALLECLILPFFYDEIEPDQKIIYEKIFGSFASKRAPVDQTLMGFITAQRAGTCSYAVLLVLVLKVLSKKIPDPIKRLSIFKKFNLANNLISLISSYRTYNERFKDPTPETSLMHQLLYRGAKKMMRDAAKLYQPDNPLSLSREDAQTSYATCLDLVRKIDEAQGFLKNQTISTLDLGNQTTNDFETLQEKMTSLLRYDLRTIDSARDSIQSPIITNGKRPLPNQVLELLKHYLHIIQKSKSQPFACRLQIEHLFSFLPIPKNTKDFWDEISIEEQPDCLSLLDQLSDIYLEIIADYPLVTPLQSLTGFTICAIIHKVALNVDTEIQAKQGGPAFSSYGFYCSILDSAADPALIFFHPTTFQRYSELVSYFVDCSIERGLFDMREFYLIDDNKVLKDPTCLYYNALLESHPEIITEWTKAGGKRVIADRPQTRVRTLDIAELYADTGQQKDQKKISLFAHNRIRHVGILKKAAFMSAFFAGRFSTVDLNQNPHSVFECLNISDEKGPVQLCFYYRNHLLGNKYKTAFNRIVLRQRSSSLDDFISSFKGNSRLLTSSQKLPTESEALTTDEDFGSVQLRRTTCEPSLQPYLVLAYYCQHLHKLEHPDEQSVFDFLFFKSLIKNNKDLKFEFSLFDQIKQQPQLLFSACDLILGGLNIFYHLQPGNRPQIYACVHFLHLSLRLKQVLEKHHSSFKSLPDEKLLLQQWLELMDLKNGERKLLYLLRLFSFKLIPPQKITPEELSEIIQTWFYYKNEACETQWKIPYWEEEVNQWFFTLQGVIKRELRENEGLRNTLLHTIVKKLGVNLATHLKWEEKSYPCYRLRVDIKSYWEVNLLTRVIASETSLYSSSDAHHWTKHSAYRRLFGDQLFDFKRVGPGFYFVYQGYDYTFFVENNQLSSIQRQKEGITFEYFPPEVVSDIIGDIYGYHFVTDHTHWFNLKEPRHPSGVVLAIHDLKTDEIRATLHKDGSLKLANQAKVEPLPLYPELLNLFNSFERKPYISIFSLKQQGIVSLPRFQSLDGNPLYFAWDPKNQIELRWAENPQLSLKPSSHKALLGEIYNYLPLVDQMGQIRKILVPVQRFVQQNDFALPYALDIEDSHRRREPLYNELLSPQKNVYTYLEFEILDGKVVSNRTEEVLYQAYLELVQYHYQDALNSIKNLKISDHISKTSFKIIKWILKSFEDNHDHSPSAAAIRLHLFIFCLKIMNRPNLELKLKRELTRKDCLAYLGALKTIDQDLRLGHDEEQMIFKYHGADDLVSSFVKRDSNLVLAPPLSSQSYKRIDLDLSIYQSVLLQALEAPVSIQSVSFLRPEYDELISTFRPFYQLAMGSRWQKRRIEFFLNVAHLQDNFRFWCLFNCLDLALKASENPSYLALDPHLTRLRIPEIHDPMEAKLAWIKHMHSTKLLNVETKQGEAPSARPEKVYNNPFSLIGRVENHPPSNFDYPLELTLSLNPTIDPIYWGARFAVRSRSESTEKKVVFQIPLADDEKAYSKTTLRAAKDFQENYQKGQFRRVNQVAYELHSEFSIEETETQLKEIASLLKTKLLDLKNKILLLANAPPSPPNSSMDLFLRERMLQESGAKKKISLSSLIKLFLKRSALGFHEANKTLSKDEINQLYQWIGEFLFRSIEEGQIEKALKLLPQAKKKPSSSPLIQKLANHLLAPCAYQPHLEIECLVLEFQSGLRMRQEQYLFLKEMLKTDISGHYSNKIAQLIMGGGKSTIIASLLGFLATKLGRLSLFIVPSALFEKTKLVLKKTQKENFDQEIHPIDLDSQQFNLDNLKKIQHLLLYAMSHQEIVLIKAEFVQSLWLELIALIADYAKLTNEAATAEMKEKISVLQRILNIFNDQTDALGDEADQLLEISKEVNRPSKSHETPIKFDRIDLIKEIFLSLVNEQIYVDKDTTLADFVGLKANRQARLKEYEYHSLVKPHIANHLWHYFKTFNVPAVYEQSFYRYLTLKIAPELQKLLNKEEDLSLETTQQQDLEFLKYLHILSLSPKEKEKKVPDLIALSKHMLNIVLPATLKRSGNRHYGRALTKAHGKIVPYLGVNAPAQTKFGYHYEAIAYHFQQVIYEGVNEVQLLDLAKEMKNAAEYFSKIHCEPFDKTTEAVQFRELTGVSLHLIEDPVVTKQALQTINNDFHRRLCVEANTIAQHVTYYTQHLNSDALMLVNTFKTFRTFTGTPWNVPTFDFSLVDNCILDEGTEGQIAYELLRKNGQIHFMEGEGVSFFKTLKLTHPNYQKIRCYLDVGGYCKGHDNLTIATQLLEQLPHISGVVFFWQPPGKKTADTPAILKKNFVEPIAIENPAESGVPLDSLFFYYDERHNTGIHFDQLPDTISLMTIDENLFLNSFLQSVLRQRQFLDGDQSIEFVIHPAVSNALLGKGKSILDLLNTSLKNQTFKLAEQTLRSFKRQLIHLPRMHALKKLLKEEELPKMVQILKENEEVIFVRTLDRPYEQYGAIEDSTEVIQLLQYQAKKLEAKMMTPLSFDEIIERAKASRYLPLKVNSAFCDELGLEVLEQEVQEQEVQVEMEQLVEQQVELELLNELAFYDFPSSSPLRSETLWDRQEAEKLFAQGLKEYENVQPLKQLFEYSFSKIAYKKDYSEVFDSQIYVTENFRLTYGNAMPVFHLCQKPAEQILLFEAKHQLQVLFVTLAEAKFFKKFLQKLYSKKAAKAWLVLADGTPLEYNPHYPDLPKDLPRILLQANLFNGNAIYLEQQQQATISWLYEKFTDEKLHFLKLKAFRSPEQKEVFYRSPIFSKDKNPQLKPGIMTFSAREQYTEKKEELFQNLTVETLPDLPEDQIPFIPHALVEHLTEPAQIVKLTKAQLPFVVPHQVPFLIRHQIILLKKGEQVQALTENQLSFISSDQVSLCSDRQLKKLKKKYLIRAVPSARIDQIDPNYYPLLTPQQIKGIQDPALYLRLGSSQLVHLSPKQVLNTPRDQLDLLPNPILKYLGEHQVQSLPLERLKYIASSQIRCLKTKEQIQAIKPELVRYMTPNQIPLVSNQQLLRLQESQVNDVSSEQVPQLHDALFKALSMRDLIRAVPLNKINFISPQAVQHVTDEQLHGLIDPALIRSVPSHRLLALFNLSNCDNQDERRKFLIAHLAKDQVKTIPPELVPLLHDPQIPWIRGSESLSKVPLNKVNQLIPKQMRWISDPSQIQALTKISLIRNLDPNLSHHLVDKQIPYVTPEQVPFLAAEKLSFLQTKEQVARVSFNRIWELSPKARVLISWEQRLFLAAYTFTSCLLAVIGVVFQIATFGAYLLKTRYEFCHKVWQQTSRPVNNLFFTIQWIGSSRK